MAAQPAEAAAREASLQAEQEARDAEFAERTAREAERQAAPRCPLCGPQSSKAKRQIESPIDTEEIDLYDKLLRETDFARQEALMRLPALMVTDGP